MINDKDSDISIANYNGVGGSSVLYSAHLPRFLPEDFKNKSINGINSKWPISYNALKKFYSLNEKILGVDLWLFCFPFGIWPSGTRSCF